MKSECQFFNIKFEKTWRILPVLVAAVREIVCRLFSLSLKRESLVFSNSGGVYFGGTIKLVAG